jgi:SAM-dependent methyltransferase
MSAVKSNEEQIAYWNGRAGASWTDLADRTDAMLAPTDDALLEAAQLTEGERVLDVGCGCGATSLRAVKLVAPAGAIVGVDVSEPMLGRARVRAAGHPELSFRLEDAATATFDAPFDIAISRFGVMFFEDPVAAFTNVRAALVEDVGRLAFVCWQHPSKNAWVGVPMDAARPFVPEVAPPAPGTPGPFAFADRGRVETILAEAGFVDVAIEARVSPLSMGNDPEDLLVQLSRIGPLARVIADVPADVGRRALEAARDAIVAQASDGLALEGAYWVVRARRG